MRLYFALFPANGMADYENEDNATLRADIFPIVIVEGGDATAKVRTSTNGSTNKYSTSTLISTHEK